MKDLNFSYKDRFGVQFGAITDQDYKEPDFKEYFKKIAEKLEKNQEKNFDGDLEDYFIKLSKKDQIKLVKDILTPPEPTEKQKQTAQQYKQNNQK